MPTTTATPATERVALNMLIEKELLKLVDDYRYKHRFPTRVEAVKAMLRVAVKEDAKKK